MIIALSALLCYHWLMAKITLVQCDWVVNEKNGDTCKQDAPISVNLTFDEKPLTLDLCKEHGTVLTAHARPSAPPVSMTRSRAQKPKEQPSIDKAAREWALSQPDWASKVNSRGRQPKDLKAAFVDATGWEG